MSHARYSDLFRLGLYNIYSIPSSSVNIHEWHGWFPIPSGLDLYGVPLTEKSHQICINYNHHLSIVLVVLLDYDEQKKRTKE